MASGRRSLALVIVDGLGIGKADFTNPIVVANPKNLDAIRTGYRGGALQASGIAVGLPWNEEGSSEVGHMTIGAGRTVYQHYPKISLAIRDGSLGKNEVLSEILRKTREGGGALHLVGLLSAGNVVSAEEHLVALLEIAKQSGVRRLSLHLATDGSDSPPRSALKLLERIEVVLVEVGVGKVASLAGRFYALDRDSHWDRVEKAYRTIALGEGPRVERGSDAIRALYDRGLGDEYLEPTRVGEPSPMAEGDAVLFFNFREDSSRELAAAFGIEGFQKFKTSHPRGITVATMTTYGRDFGVPALFPNEDIRNTLGEVIAANEFLQLRIAEAEKYAHVTYFMNGYREAPFPNEYRVVVPSGSTVNYAESPGMQTPEIANRVVSAITDRGFDFIIANLANTDLVAHTGNFDAAVEAVRVADEALGRIVRAGLEHGTTVLVTADHGHIERLVDPLTGRPEATHSTSLVPCYVADVRFASQKSLREAEGAEREAVGILSDIAPTILDILGIQKPAEMTGESLLGRLS